jgi:hypothetical protein
MERKSRRAILGGLAAGLATILAGCSGGGGDDGGDGDDGSGATPTATAADPTSTATRTPTETETATPTPAVDVTGSVGENAVDGIAVASLSLREYGDGEMIIDFVVENTGSETTNVGNYGYDVALFDGDGNTIPPDRVAKAAVAEDTPPGGTEDTGLLIEFPADATVARYELSVNCDTDFDAGVYCG